MARDGFTLEENLADLEGHARDHDERTAFTYTVLDPTGTRCLGCVYIVPPHAGLAGLAEGAAWPADVSFWVRASEVADGLDAHLLAALREWLAAEWAFDRILFPVAVRYPHHAALFEAAGLRELMAFADDDGERWRVFG